MPSLFGELDRVFRNSPFPVPTMRSLGGIGSTAPATFFPESSEVDGKHILKFPLPGVSKEDVNVKVVDGNRVIVGYNKTSEDEKSSEDLIYATTLPRHADPTTAKARIENGVVIVEMEPREGSGEVDVPIE